MTDEYDDYDFDEDEVTALWDGRLPMDRVLQTLQSEIEERQQTHAQLAAAVARAEAAEAEAAALREQLSAREWRPVTEPPTEAGTYLAYYRDGELGVIDWHIVEGGGLWQSYSIIPFTHWQPLPAPPGSDEDGAA